MQYNRSMTSKLSNAWLIPILLVLIAAFVWLGPSEAELGSNVRVVYLHGAWVWTALIGFGAAAIFGIIGLVRGTRRWLRQSKVLGQTGALFWISYLPISLWAMQANWNGLFLLEPRWRIGMDFALVAILLQAAILLLRLPRVTGILNFAFAGSLVWALSRAEQIMHPPSPITSSNSLLIQTYFFLLTGLCLALGWFVSRSLLELQSGS
jgi:hypothetical protein